MIESERFAPSRPDVELPSVPSTRMVEGFETRSPSAAVSWRRTPVGTRSFACETPLDTER